MAPAQPQDKTLAHSPPRPQPRLPALPEALKGPDCAQEVSEQRLYEYMKESIVEMKYKLKRVIKYTEPMG